MKLLICTQAVDQNDPILGFFHRWIEEFASHVESVTVICLREGAHSLPKNVQVFALGKGSRITRAYKLLRLSLRFKDQYDTVFVHMNPEYLVASGLLWRVLGKRTALWYTHKHVDTKLRVAAFFADTILTASKESFRLKNTKVRVMGHGIDTEFFTPDQNTPREHWALSAGRLTKSKRHDLAIRAAAQEAVELRIAGDGPERQNLETLAGELHADVHFLGSMTQTQLREQYRKAAYLVHTSETGSLDKVVLEALACGLPIKTNDPALKHLEGAQPELVAREHSLKRLIPDILKIIS